jgi:4-carboxymuconolactone decarboxylase
MKQSKPPKTYDRFVARYPKLGEAWRATREAEARGPLDPRVARLVKLAVAIGALKEGAVHSAARKALEAGVTPAEMEQVVALAAATIGLPSTVAVDTWVQEIVAAR